MWFYKDDLIIHSCIYGRICFWFLNNYQDYCVSVNMIGSSCTPWSEHGGFRRYPAACCWSTVDLIQYDFFNFGWHMDPSAGSRESPFVAGKTVVFVRSMKGCSKKLSSRRPPGHSVKRSLSSLKSWVNVLIHTEVSWEAVWLSTFSVRREASFVPGYVSKERSCYPFFHCLPSNEICHNRVQFRLEIHCGSSKEFHEFSSSTSCFSPCFPNFMVNPTSSLETLVPFYSLLCV